MGKKLSRAASSPLTTDADTIVRTFEEEAARADHGFPAVAAQYRSCPEIIRNGGSKQDIVWPDSLPEERQRLKETSRVSSRSEDDHGLGGGGLSIREEDN